MQCKGTWQNSARNIKYDQNKLTCELRNHHGEYIKNQLLFFPHYEYENVDGKFEWPNCRNGVELNHVSHDSISRRYKEVTIKQCLEHLTHEFDDWFAIDKSYVQSIKDQCISISLFRKNANNSYDHEFPVSANWKSKYYDELIRNLNEYDSNTICVNLYLAQDLSEYIPTFLKYKFLNLFLMKSSSIGAQPGALWRFREITNPSYQTVYLADIDETWEWVFKTQESSHKLTTLLPADILISKDPYSPAYNFPTIMAGHAIYHPKKFNYNMVDVMKGFLSLCKKREKSKNPYGFNDDPITFWNQPIVGHELGWGRNRVKYGFDEFFLKHVVYYDAYPSVRFV
jgi:hypothetical protein